MSDLTPDETLRTMVVAYADVLDGALEPLGPRAGSDSGDPQTSGITFFEGHGVEVGVWECTPGGWAIVDRPTTETMRGTALWPAPASTQTSQGSPPSPSTRPSSE